MNLRVRLLGASGAWTIAVASWACGAPAAPQTHLAKPTTQVDGCAAEARRLEARGDLDGALEALGGCSSGPSVEAKIDVLLALGEVDLAKRAATELEQVDASRAGRAKAVLAMKTPVERVRDARAAADRGTLAVAKGNEVEASRELARARHLYARVTKAQPERVLVSTPSAAKWIADQPSWEVTVDSLPIDEKRRERARALGHFDPDLRVIELRLEESGTWLSWPGHPKGFVHATADDLSVVDGDAVKHLDVRGRPSFSPDGSRLLVAGETTLTVYSTSSWQKQLELAVRASGGGQWLRGGSLYAETEERLGPAYKQVDRYSV